MNKYLLLVSLLVVSEFAASKTITGSACVPDTGNPVVDEITAKALAKGQLSHELGATVNARTELKSITTEGQGQAQTQDVLTEQVTLSSQHTVAQLKTVSSDYQNHNGSREYCVTVSL